MKYLEDIKKQSRNLMLGLFLFLPTYALGNAPEAVDCTREKMCGAHSQLMKHILTPILESEVAESINLLKTCATKGHPFAQFSLGYAYETGNGLPQNRKDALEYYLKAGNAGSIGAILLLPDYFNGAMGPDLAENKIECYAWAAVGRKLNEKIAALARRERFCKGTEEQKREGEKRAEAIVEKMKASPLSPDLVVNCQ